jgi:carbon storage regulator CsrA
MLVLSRNEGGVIHAGDITIKVLRIGDRTVKLGITAPAETKILRGELAEQLKPIAGKWVEVDE